MNCANCHAPLGPTYLRCPSCGAKVSAATPIVIEPPPISATGVARGLVLPPRRRALPLTVLGVVLCLIFVMGLVLANNIMRQVYASVSARFDSDWDRLLIEPAFESRSFLGATPLAASGVTYEIRDSSGKILYQGANSRPKINEGALRSRERLLIKACLAIEKPFGTRTESHCATTELTGSEKRSVVLTQTIRLVDSSAPERLQYAFIRERQRRTYDGQGTWQSLLTNADPVILESWIGDDTARKVRVRVRPGGTLTNVDLRSGEGYSGFEAAFLEAEGRSPEVPVNARFILQEGSDSNAPPKISFLLRAKTSAERLGELRHYATRLARQVVEDGYMGGNNVRASVVNWRFDRRTHQYRADTQIEWQGKFMSTNHYWIRGDVQIGEDGIGGRFELTSEGDAIRSLRNKGIVAGVAAAIATKAFSNKP